MIYEALYIYRVVCFWFWFLVFLGPRSESVAIVSYKRGNADSFCREHCLCLCPNPFPFLCRLSLGLHPLALVVGVKIGVSVVVPQQVLAYSSNKVVLLAVTRRWSSQASDL